MGVIKYKKIAEGIKINSDTFYLYDIFQLINTNLNLDEGLLSIRYPDANNFCLVCCNQNLERIEEVIEFDTIIDGVEVDLNNKITIIKDRKPLRKSKITYGDIENICNSNFDTLIIHSMEDESELVLDLSNDTNFNYDLRNLYITEAESFEFNNKTLKINVNLLW